MNKEYVIGLAHECGAEVDGYYRSIDDSSVITFKFTEDELIKFSTKLLESKNVTR